MTVTRTVPKAVGALRAVVPRGVTLAFQFDPEQLLKNGGVGGMNRVARDRLVDASEYGGTPAYELPIQLIFDGYPDTSIEPQLQQLAVWGQAVPGGEPPVLQLLYGGLDSMRWTINDITENSERRRSDSARVQANLTVTLLEHIGVGSKSGPGDSIRRNAFAPTIVPAAGGTVTATGRTYVVKKGDTLTAIAARLLGKASRWQDIAKLNGIRDPSKLKVGQKLKIPAS